MKITVCDICGEKIPALQCRSKNRLHEVNFAIVTNCGGNVWDICDKCRDDLAKFIQERSPKLKMGKYGEKECQESQ